MQLIEMKTAAEAPKKGQTLYSYLIQFKAKKKFYLTISMKRNTNRDVKKSNIFSEIIMCLSKKSKIALILIMITASACFAQKWKGIVKGIESRTGGNNNSQAIEKNEPKETNNAKKNTAKLSNNPQVHRKKPLKNDLNGFNCYILMVSETLHCFKAIKPMLFVNVAFSLQYIAKLLQNVAILLLSITIL